ncbi:hypothetical protein VNO77_42337 [Canavalia gladiata]|uniref:Uncharacterized protein n=1 Tax=Canavalia gladiata TaxID=3824 RepID=A0AAN9K2B7_CANGL
MIPVDVINSPLMTSRRDWLVLGGLGCARSWLSLKLYVGVVLVRPFSCLLVRLRYEDLKNTHDPQFLHGEIVLVYIPQQHRGGVELVDVGASHAHGDTVVQNQSFSGGPSIMLVLQSYHDHNC